MHFEETELNKVELCICTNCTNCFKIIWDKNQKLPICSLNYQRVIKPCVYQNYELFL